MPTTSSTSDLRLDADHRYWLGERELLGPTAMLTDVGYIDPQWFTEAACLYGQYVHQAIALDLAQELEGFEDGMGYVDAARAFLRDSEAEVWQVETSLADPVLGVAGTPDVVGRIFGHAGVVDWKTGVKARWHRYQVAVYAHLVRCDRAEGPITRTAVYLKPTGQYAIETCSDRRDWQIAQAVIAIAHDKRGTA